MNVKKTKSSKKIILKITMSMTLCPPSLEGLSTFTRAETILPAFGVRSKVFRMLLGLATLEEPAPHLSIHHVRQRLVPPP